MKDQWLEKNVDLDMLAERIGAFFHETEFETTAEKMKGGYLIQAVSKIPNLRLRLDVEILGQPNDFTVEFSAGGKGGYFSPSMIVGYLTSMFGGGYLVSSESKKRETLEAIEDDFWRHAQMQVADLVGSATHKNSQCKTS